MKTIRNVLVFSLLGIFLTNCLSAQQLTESLEIIQNSVKDGVYYNFTISGDGFLSYNWGSDDDNNTLITIDLSNVTIAKDYSLKAPKVWINCIDGNSCIEERGRMGGYENMYFNYSRTYIPCNNEEDVNAMFLHLKMLISYSTGQ